MRTLEVCVQLELASARHFTTNSHREHLTQSVRLCAHQIIIRCSSHPLHALTVARAATDCVNIWIKFKRLFSHIKLNWKLEKRFWT